MADFETMFQNALIALAAGRYDTARRLLTGLVAARPNDEKGWLYLAVALPREQAIQALQKVLMLNPRHKQALRSLKLLRQNPEARLDLADVLVEEEENQEAVFGNEPATIPVSRLAAIFGDEPPTIPVAFQTVLNQKKPGSEEHHAPEAGLIGSLLAEDWTAHPPPKEENSLAQQRVNHPTPPKEQVRPSSWADSAADEDDLPPFSKPSAPRAIPIGNARLTPKLQSASANFPISSLSVDPRSIEGRVASVTRNPATPPPERHSARWVQSPPLSNIDMRLPSPRPSSHRRSHRLHHSSVTGLTAFGYLVMIILIVVLLVYLYGSLQAPVGIVPDLTPMPRP